MFVQKKEELSCFSNRGMKKIAMVIAIMALTYNSFAVTKEATVNLNVCYPDYTKINLVWADAKGCTERCGVLL